MSEELVTSNNLGSSRLAKATPTRAAGLERLSNFTSTGLKLYTDGRNYDYGPEDRSNISALSPWVRRRLISEQEIIEKLFKTIPMVLPINTYSKLSGEPILRAG